MGSTSAAKKRSDAYQFGEQARHFFKTFNGNRLAQDGKPVPHPNDLEQRKRFPERKPKKAKQEG
jgi:hypothetical protein